MDRVVAAEPIHPGEYIRDELCARDWTQADLARVLDMSVRQITSIINEKSGITPDVAHGLAQAFQQSAETWMNLQVSYELAIAAAKQRDRSKIAAGSLSAFRRAPSRP